MRQRPGVVCALFATAAATMFAAAPPDFERARELYNHTAYRESLALLAHAANKDAAILQLIGQDYFMLAEYKKASEALEKAAALEPHNPRVLLWLGRAYGRRAETSSPFTAPMYASKARQLFERSVAIDPANKDATGDLLDYYLDAPGFLGGGMQKAEALVKTIASTDPAEGHYAQAIVDSRRKEFDAAEQQFRRAVELAPHQVGRVMDLAKFLARRGRVEESEALFERAAALAPNSPRLMFERASTYVEVRRNLNQARDLLQRYLRSSLTPDDPPREQAEALLKKIG